MWTLTDTIEQDYMDRKIIVRQTVSIAELDGKFFVRHKENGHGGESINFYYEHQDIIHGCVSNLNLHRGMETYESAKELAVMMFGIKSPNAPLRIHPFKKPILESVPYAYGMV